MHALGLAVPACYSSPTPLARPAAVKRNPKENTDKNRCSWLVHSDLGPQSASTYRHCKASGDQHGGCSAESSQILSTLKTARDRPNSHALTVASPTQLQRSPPKKQHPVVEDSAPAHPAVKAGQSRLETMVGGRGRHSINYVNTMGRGGSPRTSFQRDTFISKEVLSPHLLPGNEGAYFSSSYGENKGQGVVSSLSALFQLF